MPAAQKFLFPSASSSNALQQRLRLKRRLALALAHRRNAAAARHRVHASASSDSTVAYTTNAPLPRIATSRHLSADELTEMRRLSALLPVHLQQSNASAVQRRRFAPVADKSTGALDALQIVTCAAKYISQLTATVVARVQNGTLPREALDSIPPGCVPRNAISSATTTPAVRRPNASKSTQRVAISSRVSKRRQL